MLQKADSLGLLTQIGKDALRELRHIIDDSEGRWGDLSGLGKRQHRQIAYRMVERFPEVFSDDAFVDARSTTVNRCVAIDGCRRPANSGSQPQSGCHHAGFERGYVVYEPSGRPVAQ